MSITEAQTKLEKNLERHEECLKDLVRAAKRFQLETIQALKFHLKDQYTEEELDAALDTWGDLLWKQL